MVSKQDIWQLLPAGTKTPVGISDESELLRTDLRRES